MGAALSASERSAGINASTLAGTPRFVARARSRARDLDASLTLTRPLSSALSIAAGSSVLGDWPPATPTMGTLTRIKDRQRVRISFGSPATPRSAPRDLIRPAPPDPG